MANIPDKLQEILSDFEFMTDRNDRAQYLIDIADGFEGARVPERIATQPYNETHLVKECESQAYVWAEDRGDGTFNFWFDVLNPQGLSSMAVSAILHDACSGTDLEQVAAITPEMIFTLFGRDISMGKGFGLMGIVKHVVYAAEKELRGRA